MPGPDLIQQMAMSYSAIANPDDPNTPNQAGKNGKEDDGDQTLTENNTSKDKTNPPELLN